MSPEEQRLADLLKRSVPEPPREITYEEITVPHVHRSRHSWLMPTLAAAAVVVIGVTLGAVAHHSGGTTSLQPAAAGSTSATRPSASPSSTGCASGRPQAAVIVPNLIGEQFSVAQASLQAMGLEDMMSVGKAPIAGAPQVVRQSPAAGTKVPLGSVVWLYNYGVGGPGPSPAATTPTDGPTGAAATGSCSPTPTSSGSGGPWASNVVVPSVIGQTAIQAAATLQAAGFPVTMIARPGPKSGGPVPAGEVRSQTPTANTALPTGTVITLYYEPKS